MTEFTTHTIENAPQSAKPFLKGAQDAYSFVPNLLGNMAIAPALLEGYMTLSGIFDKTDLSETERQIILMTNNRLNNCTYCMAAHTSISQMANVPADVIEALRTDAAIADPKLEALRKFTEVVNSSRGWPSANDITAFLNAGYTQQSILEVVLGTSLKVMSNYTNHITQTKLDDAFVPNAWTSTARSAA